MFEDTHPVYSVKGVSVIPLVESRATSALQTLSHILTASLNRQHGKENSDGELETPIAGPSNSDGATSPPRVKFAAEDQVKTMTPLSKHEFEHTLDHDDESIPPSPSSSVASTPSSDSAPNAGNIAKVLADKLSFWSRLSKRTSQSVVSAAGQQGVVHEEEALESLMQGESPPPSASPTNLDAAIADGTKEPAQVLNTILQETAPPPPTTEEKHNELEDKIIRECVREFTRGGMYFAYTFGKLLSTCNAYLWSDLMILDITRSMQQKQELIAKGKKQNTLLAELNALEDTQKLSPLGEKVDIFAEPSGNLPLWRRVDRQFWWNEWLSKPFIDAGVSL